MSTTHIHHVPSLFDRWFEGVGAPLGVTAAERAFRPTVDLVEYPDRYEVVADLPGVEEKSVQVEFTDGALQLRGERLEEASEEGRVFRQERATGKFGRSIAFGDDIDVEHIEASFRLGVLRVKVPKSARRQPRQIQVAVH